MHRIPESDWKIFKKVRARALERFSQRILEEIDSICVDDTGTAHERYGKVYGHIHDRNREMAAAFDEMSRSNAILQLMLMHRLRLLTEEEVSQFSPEIRNRLSQQP